MEPGKFSRCHGVRGLHGSVKESAGYWRPRAAALGEAAGRWAQRALDTRGAEALRSIMGLCQLAAKHRASDLNAARAKAMDTEARLPALRESKNLLEAGHHAPGQRQMALREADPIIRPLGTYADFIRNRTSAGDNLFPLEPEPSTAPAPVTLTELPTTSKAS